MAWYSILPSHLTVYETWIIRVFLFLAVLNMSPWVLAIIYDLLLYCVRRAWHELPVYGGRARGELRPRAPSLADRTRRMSIAELIGGGSPSRRREEEREQLRQRARERTISNDNIFEEEDEK